MMRASHGSLARTKPQREHGRHIFAYCNVNTNQVLYSLTQVLQGNASLKQLPDAGANNNPPKLRKDLWRPLWSVTLPDGKNGLAQGLHAFKKLREWRKQHELNWTPPPELARPTSEEEIETIKRELQERGGNKTETAYDIIKRRKKKLRQRMVMDQRANSIADLAAVLSEQDTLGAATGENQTTAIQQERDAEVQEMLSLAEQANNDGIGKLEAEIAALQARRQAKKEGNSDEEVSIRSMGKSLNDLEKQRRKMQFAANAVAAANQGLTFSPGGGSSTDELDLKIQEQLGSLKEQIEARRAAESARIPDVTTSMDQASGESAAEKSAVDSPNQISSAQIRTQSFRHGYRETALELEMIRRLHARPGRVDKALSAYSPRQSDIDRLRSLAALWESMFGKALQRYQDALDRQQTSGKGDHGVNFRTQVLKDGVAWLNDFVTVMCEGQSVEDMESRIEAHKAAYPSIRPDFVLRPDERGEFSHLKVMGPDRAYATALAKVKVEIRAAELARELEAGPVAQEVVGEDAEPEPEVVLEQRVAEGGTAPPTMEELRKAVAQVRRSTARLADIDRANDYAEAAQKLRRGEALDDELKSAWTDLPIKEKEQKYTEYVEQLRHSVRPLEEARQMLAGPGGVEDLVKAAESARERSVAARSTGEDEVAVERKFAAKVFERVAALKEAEDVVLRAPLKPVEESAQDESQQGSMGASAAAAGSQTSEATQQGEQTAEGETNVAAQAVDYHALLPSFPEKTILPKKGPLRKKALNLRRPIFTATGVTVRWNNPLDAEYAEQWPEAVQHEAMGLSRHTAPRVNQQPIFDVAEYKNQPGGGYTGKKFARRMEKEELRERVKGVTERVLEAVRAREEAEGARTSMESREERHARRRQAWILKHPGEVPGDGMPLDWVPGGENAVGVEPVDDKPAVQQ